MTSRFTELAVDCHDPRRLAEFWCAALGYATIADTGDQVEIAAYEPTVEGVRAAPGPPTLLFIRVPEGKERKNRLHPDISPIDDSRDGEVDRLIALGATRVDIGQGERTWVVLADPEGNEFCVLRTLAP
jgi:catechol 2,3-dioxygenase-like lactoylglutathione lyase family enzyme